MAVEFPICRSFFEPFSIQRRPSESSGAARSLVGACAIEYVIDRML